jgi:polysaccharide pyruvyl transferase CsaB
MRLARFVGKSLRGVTRGNLVAIHGFYGAANVGDDAILDATAEAILEVGLTPWVLAWSGKEVGKQTDFPADTARSLGPWRGSFHLASSRAFLLGGGGIIRDYGDSPTSLGRWMDWIERAIDMGIPSMTWSVGVEEVRYPESKERLLGVLDRLDAVTLRDTDSARRLGELGFRGRMYVTADPVVPYARRYRVERAIEKGKPTVIVCPRVWNQRGRWVEDPAAFDRLLVSLAFVLDQLAMEKRAHIRFVPLRTRRGDDDREIAGQIMAHMKTVDASIALKADPTVKDVAEAIRRSDLVIAMRLHATIIAATLGIPVLALSYTPKVAGFMEMINQPTLSLDMAGLDRGDFLDRALRIFGCTLLAEDLLRATDSLSSHYDLNKALLEAMVSGRSIEGIGNDASFRAASGGGQDLR